MIRIFADHNTLSQMAAEAIIAVAEQCLEKRGRFQLVLSGGNTPRKTYALLARQFDYKHRLWEKTHIYWADERCVPPDDPRSNYLMARETFLNRVNIPPDQIYRIRGEADDLQAEAECYDVEFPIHPDLILLGIGADGHTASLFPNSSALEETQRKFVVVQAPAQPATRITITPPALADASEIMVLVSGIDKANAVNQVFGETANIHDTPAKLVHDAIWLMDKEAAQKVTKNIIVGAQ